MNFVQTILMFTVLALATGHSQMTDPQSIAPMTCRLGGEPQFGVETCAGPCDMRAVHGGYAIHNSASNPARVYRRGQTITIKYQRNNHAPGGLNRFTIVKPEKMMDKREHTKNAFHYSCWGAHSVKAPSNEQGKEKYGYSMIGSDGEQHGFSPGYYTTKLTIPRVIPDGNYIFGWVWFGGTAGGEIENNGKATKRPGPYGYFSDYWSCSYIRIQGGAPLAASHVPTFNNDMSQFSSEGCMSANDFPGVCSYEPCRVTGRFQKPRPFKNGKKPRALTPRDFGGNIPSGGKPKNPGKPSKPPKSSRVSEETRVRRRSCWCIHSGSACRPKLARRTRNYCKAKTRVSLQRTVCKEACCVFCKKKPYAKVCRTHRIRSVCKL